MQVLFLGTSAMVPTKERNHFSFYFKYKNEGMLFDCGEGTQRQLRIAGIRPSRITRIFISHFHGDHILGLPGLFQTLSASQHDRLIKLYGPGGLKSVIERMLGLFVFDNKLKIEINEIDEGKFLETHEFYMESYRLEHGVRSLGYRFVEKERLRINLAKAKKLGLKEGPLLGKLQQNKTITFRGKKITPEEVTYKVRGKIMGFISDTIMTESVYKIAENADLLISESTHTSKEKEKAKEFKHFTSKNAGEVAKQSGAKKLVLTHFSQRYKTGDAFVKDAKEFFENTLAAEDFMKINI
ncbi:MAG: ribonuclease Z [Nanoarchaeota archaeon]